MNDFEDWLNEVVYDPIHNCYTERKNSRKFLNEYTWHNGCWIPMKVLKKIINKEEDDE